MKNGALKNLGAKWLLEKKLISQPDIKVGADTLEAFCLHVPKHCFLIPFLRAKIRKRGKRRRRKRRRLRCVQKFYWL